MATKRQAAEKATTASGRKCGLFFADVIQGVTPVLI